MACGPHEAASYELVAAAHQFFSFLRQAGGSNARGGDPVRGVSAFVTGFPIALFSCCAVTEPSRRRSSKPHRLGARPGIPDQVWIAEPPCPSRGGPLEARPHTRAELFPGMILDPPPEPPPPPAGITILAGAQTSREEFVGVNVEAGLPGEIAERLFPPSFASDPDVQLFVARLTAGQWAPRSQLQPRGGRCLQRGDAAGRASPWRRDRSDVGSGRGGPRLGAGHDRPPVHGDGAPALRRPGIPTVAPYATFS